ncbi:minor tail protein L [Serratia phage vB_SlqS_ZDD2]|nr:minor tail protein L [Serratia phage vB_SlqS_ZDD2]
MPARTIQPICEWGVKGWYKSGNGCHYKGQNGFFNEKGERVQDESMDVCGCLVKDCKLRFGENEELDFGGMPAAGLIR